MEKNNIKIILLYAFFISFCFGMININIGFTLKPYMIISLLIFMLNIKKIVKTNSLFKSNKNEIKIIIFIIYIAINTIFSTYIKNSIRFFLAAILMFIIYNIIKFFLEEYTKEEIQDTLLKVGIFYAIITIIYYIIGMMMAKQNVTDVNFLGITIDRGMKRLISFASDDPNISVIYFSLFYSFYLCNFKRNISKIGTILYLILVVLTMSRGGIIALIITSLFILLKNYKRYINKKNIAIASIIITILVLLCVNVGALNKIIVKRISTSFSDGGSGRLQIWELAIKNFSKHPIMGIGINATIPYNTLQYNENHYIHNTYLEVLSELGLIGMTIYLSIVISFFRTTLKNEKTNFNNSVTCLYLLILLQQLFLSLLLNEIFILSLALITISQNKKQIGENNNDNHKN